MRSRRLGGPLNEFAGSLTKNQGILFGRGDNLSIYEFDTKRVIFAESGSGLRGGGEVCNSSLGIKHPRLI